MRINPTSFVFALAVVMTSGSVNFAAADSDPVLAKVNGTEIHQSDVKLLEATAGENLPEGASPEKKQQALLSYLIDMNVLSQVAETKKLDKSADFPQRIAFARKQLLVQALMEQESKNAVSDKDIKKFYDEKLKPQQEVHARHILVETEAQAKDIVAQLKKGADFAELAKKNSKDPGSDGGDLGFITKDQVVPEFGNVAFSLEKGKISDPVKTQFGWHIIKVEDKRERKPPPLDQVKDRIRAVLAQQASAEMVQKLRGQAKIENLTAPAPAPAEGKKK